MLSASLYRHLRAVLLLAFSFTLVLSALATTADAQYLQTGDLTLARRGHTATLLRDGRILILGGQSATGLEGRSEFIDPNTGAVSVGPAGTPRIDHTATLLKDGRVLVAGGRGVAGGLASTEIYDPASNSFVAGPNLTRARAGHSALALRDGRILIAGGDAAGSAEIVDPDTLGVMPLAYRMTVPRFFHGVALLPEGDVLIAGGARADGTLLASAELFDPLSLSFRRTLRSMGIERFAPTFAVLPDGKVQIIGGDVESTMEVFSAGGLFGGLAHLPPSLGLLDPTLTSRPRAALFTLTGAENPALAGAAPETLALLDREDHTLTEASGRAVVAGGVDGSGQVTASIVLVASSAASVTTDELDYAPGRAVTISGAGWRSGEVVVLTLREEPETHPDVTATSVADSEGRFENRGFAPGTSDVGRAFTVTAVGLSSGRTAQTTFSDGAIGLNLDQCQNKSLANLDVPCGTDPLNGSLGWENGNVNSNNSQYREGDGLPFRLTLTGIDDGTWTAQLSYDFTKGGIFAVDRLTTFDLTQASDPCSETTDVTCAVGGPAFDFEIPSEVVTPSATAPALPNGGTLAIAGSNATLTAADTRMTVWVEGGSATFISTGQNWTGSQSTSFNDNRVSQDGLSTGDSTRAFAFKFTLTGCPAAGCNMALGWTGHLASAVDWGAGEGASSISGSSFHMQIVGIDHDEGRTGGSQDRSSKLQDFVVPPGGVIIIKKVTDPASDTATSFGFTDTGGLTPSTFSLKNGGAITFVSLVAGTYTVSESTVPASWNLTNLVCDDPTSDSTTDLSTRKATINLASNETVTCTFTNSHGATIKVDKATTGGVGSFSYTTVGSGPAAFTGGFSRDTTAANPTTSTAISFDGTQLGDKYITETVPAGWTLTNIVCSGGTTVIGTGTGASFSSNASSGYDAGDTTVKVSLASGDSVACTFTNTKAASIKVDKASTGGVGSFSYTTAGSGPSEFTSGLTRDTTAANPTTSTAISFDGTQLGDKYISETVPAGWTLTNIACSGGTTSIGTGTGASFNNNGADGFNAGDTTVKVSLASGDSVACTFTNTRQGKIIVKKVVEPAGVNGSFTFSGDLSGSIGNGQTIEKVVVPGTYTTTEADPSAQFFFLNTISCDDGNSTGDPGTRTATFRVEAGETVTCTFTNVQVLPEPPRLIVIKHVVNDNGGTAIASQWTLKVTSSNGGTGTGSEPGAESPGTTYTLQAGKQYSVSESGGPSGYKQTSAIGDCTIASAAAGATYTCTITNDDNAYCPENKSRIPTRTVIPSRPVGGFPPNYATVQDAYNAATNGEIIGLYSQTVENVTLGGAKSLTITQCTTARVTAADNTLPVWNITSTGKLLIVGPDAAGGTVGWQVGGNGGHKLSSVRASGASASGILVTSNGNSISWNSLNGNAVGLRVTGGSNDLRGGTVASNAGDGVQIAGSSNTFQGATVQANGGNGVAVSGANNTIKNNASQANAKDGFYVNGTGNLLSADTANRNSGDGFEIAATGNKLQSNASNTSASGGSNENTGYEYRLNFAVTNLGGNKADSIGIPKITVPTKCPTFPAAGTCE